MTAFGASAKMKPPSAQSRAFDATCSAWLGRWANTIPLGLHSVSSSEYNAVTTDGMFGQERKNETGDFIVLLVQGEMAGVE